MRGISHELGQVVDLFREVKRSSNKMNIGLIVNDLMVSRAVCGTVGHPAETKPRSHQRHSSEEGTRL